MGAVACKPFCNQSFEVKYTFSMKSACLVFRLSLWMLFLAAQMHGVHAQPVIADKGAKSQWISVDAKRKLIYKATEQGDKIIDFSHAGYMGGGVRLPEAPVKITLEAA